MGIKATDRAAPPSSPLGEWNRWLVSMPSRLIYTPWPFPVSVTADGLVRNVVPMAAPVAKKPRGKAPGEVVKLRVAQGDVPPQGCYLVLATGRRYRVQAVRGRQIDCVVLHPDEMLELGAEVWHWEWASRQERREAA